jgi:hypothetical protein
MLVRVRRRSAELLMVACAACDVASAPSAARPEPAAGTPAASEADVSRAPASAVTYARMIGELGIDVDGDVSEAEAEALYAMLRRSGYEPKVIRLLAPDHYSVNAWGEIPHAAVELLLRREGAGWKLLQHDTWVLFGDA